MRFAAHSLPSHRAMPKAVVATIIDAAQLMAIAAARPHRTWRPRSAAPRPGRRRDGRHVNSATNASGPNATRLGEQPPCPVGVSDRVERPAEDEDERRRSQHGDDHEPTPHLRQAQATSAHASPAADRPEVANTPTGGPSHRREQTVKADFRRASFHEGAIRRTHGQSAWLPCSCSACCWRMRIREKGAVEDSLKAAPRPPSFAHAGIEPLLDGHLLASGE